MSSEQTSTQSEASAAESPTLDSIIERAAEAVVPWAEHQGFKAWPPYFACGSGPCGAGNEVPQVYGAMRHSYSDAARDALAYAGAVAYVIRYAHPEVAGSMEVYERAMKERAAGALPGSFAVAPEV